MRELCGQPRNSGKKNVNSVLALWFFFPMLIFINLIVCLFAFYQVISSTTLHPVTLLWGHMVFYSDSHYFLNGLHHICFSYMVWTGWIWAKTWSRPRVDHQIFKPVSLNRTDNSWPAKEVVLSSTFTGNGWQFIQLKELSLGDWGLVSHIPIPNVAERFNSLRKTLSKTPAFSNFVTI